MALQRLWTAELNDWAVGRNSGGVVLYMCRSAFEMALQHLRMGESAEMKVGICVAACCSVLPCVAVCCSVW